MHVFIGYDPREDIAARVCKHSILARDPHVGISFLNDRELRLRGLYNRPYRVNGNGQFIDYRDRRPFSTMFAFTRFLVPAEARSIGLRGYAVFCDCDMLFLRPVSDLLQYADGSAVQVVKHKHISVNATKMDGVQQGNYGRKNWSSFILWNLDHPANEALITPAAGTKGGYPIVPCLPNYALGRDLHRFFWLEDNQIGDLPEAWNWLVGSSPTTSKDRPTPAVMHWTEGGPWMDGHEGAPGALMWEAEKEMMLRCEARCS